MSFGSPQSAIEEPHRGLGMRCPVMRRRNSEGLKCAHSRRLDSRYPWGMTTSCSLKYHILGVADADSPTTQVDVCEEVKEVLSYSGPVVVGPIRGGLELSISVTDIEPFTPKEFEPYIYEHVVWHAINACCEMEEDEFQFKLISSIFE